MNQKKVFIILILVLISLDIRLLFVIQNHWEKPLQTKVFMDKEIEKNTLKKIEEEKVPELLDYSSEGECESQKEKSVSMLFFGDIMLDRYIGDVIGRRGLDYLFENFQGEKADFFSGFDIIGANLEGAVTDNGAHYEPTMINDFAFKPAVVEGLKTYNFNYFTLANNHFSDQGKIGMSETRDNLDSLGFNYSGCRDRYVDEACSVKMIEIADKKIALVGFSMVYGDFNLGEAEAIIADAASSSDFVLVNIHWGQEYHHDFNKTQQNVAHALIDVGANILVGHHPHIVQGMEIYKDRPIFYSLGNFIFDQPEPLFPRDNSESIALALTLNNESFEINLFPLEFIDWQLGLIKDAEKERFFDEFLEWSTINKDTKTHVTGMQTKFKL